MKCVILACIALFAIANGAVVEGPQTKTIRPAVDVTIGSTNLSSKDQLAASDRLKEVYLQYTTNKARAQALAETFELGDDCNWTAVANAEAYFTDPTQKYIYLNTASYTRLFQTRYEFILFSSHKEGFKCDVTVNTVV